MSKEFSLTTAESDFIFHFRRESHSVIVGPAWEWLQSRGICDSVMIPLLFHEQVTNSRWLDRLYEDPIPSFQPPWSSKEEFEGRVWSALEVYPDLKDQPYVIPGYQVNSSRLSVPPEKCPTSGTDDPGNN